MEEDKIIIRDNRIKEKFFIDDCYLNGYAKLCGIYATGIYISLCRHIDKNQKCFPSQKLIAEELSIGVTAVYQALKKLEEWNIIKIIDQGKKNNGMFKNKLYLLVDKSQWIPKPSVCGTDGKIDQPSVCGTGDRRCVAPNKDTHMKDTHIYPPPSKIIDKALMTREDFGVFWKIYPRRVAKPKAQSIFMKIPQVNFGKIIEAVKQQAQSAQWQQDGGKFIPHPATWLNQQRWEDEIQSVSEEQEAMELVKQCEKQYGMEEGSDIAMFRWEKKYGDGSALKYKGIFKM